MLKRIGCIAVWGLVAAALFAPVRVLAQGSSLTDPDLRELEPYFMLVVDTSGSMEQLPKCTCTTYYCGECMPQCDLANVAGEAPLDKKNRWAVTLEALTGTFNNFQCETVQRTPLNGATYDTPYTYPYNQPWDCNGLLPGKPCAYNSAQTTLSQNNNGILDEYSTRVRFGLMTFDGVATYKDADSLIPVNDFDQARANTIDGLWSYGGGQPIHYPGCTDNFMMDTGVRNASASEGSMVALNSCAGPTCSSSCSSCPGTTVSLNNDIQLSLIKSRPFGSTPIAGALQDLSYHLREELSDQFGACRSRFALLLTDGRPDDDYHEIEGCDCGEVGEPPCPPGFDRPNSAPLHCPYRRATAIAHELVKGSTAEPDAVLSRLFVVGMAVEDTFAKAALNEIALEGCDETNCLTDTDGNTALFADDFTTLTTNLKKAINATFAPVSRSIPAFAAGGQGGQFQISAGFRAYSDPETPWEGRLERRRFICNTQGIAEPQPLDDAEGDLLHSTLSRNTTRNLTTAVPNVSLSQMLQTLTSNVSGSACGTGGCTPTVLSQVQSPAQFGVSTSPEEAEIIDWMKGGQGSARPVALGDIYHSSPVIVGSPKFDTADEAYNLFRRQTVVEHRPTTIYVNSNDGLIHAFSLNAKLAGGTGHPALEAGEEIWGFVPPLLLSKLKLNLQSHQVTLDGTPVVRDVYFSRSLTTDATDAEYHTVLVTGMRGGGNAYIALDVTDPQLPKFLWQFTDPDMGKTYAQAAIGQGRWKTGPTTSKNGAIAILPGGVGEPGDSLITGDCTSGTTRAKRNGSGANAPVFQTLSGATDNYDHRADVRCWKRQGRVLYIVDVQTGVLIKKIRAASGNDTDASIFPSPLVSSPALYQSDIGTVASRAFVTDADGVVWRIDLSDIDPANWVANPFHDMFWDLDAMGGERSYEAPLLTVDEAGQLVVIIGTGDTDNFLKPTVHNRIASLTEKITGTGTLTPGSYKALLNWEFGVPTQGGLGMVPSELVTGSMALFQGQLFFGTFIAVDASDACSYGRGRIHAVDYRLPDLTVLNVRTNPDGTPASNQGSGPQSHGPLRLSVGGISVGATSVINVSVANAVSNFMVMGLSVTQRPPCSTVEAETEVDPYGQSHSLVKDLTPPPVYLVAQASGTSDLIGRASAQALGNIELELKPKKTLSRVTSWATSVD